MNVVDYYTVLRRYIIDGVCLFVFVGLHGNYNNDYVIVRRRRRKEIDINLHTSHTHTQQTWSPHTITPIIIHRVQTNSPL